MGRYEKIATRRLGGTAMGCFTSGQAWADVLAICSLRPGEVWTVPRNIYIIVSIIEVTVKFSEIS